MSGSGAANQPSSEEALIANMKTLMVTIGDLKADMLRMLEEDAGRASCFRATRAETTRLAQAVTELEDRLGRVIERARAETLPEVDARLAEYPKVLEQLRAAELVHQAMSVISDIQCRMAALQVAVKQGRHLDCVEQVVALDGLFRRDLQLVKEDVQVLGLLRSLYITCKNSLHDAFLAMWSANFVFKAKLERPLVCSLTVGNLSEAPKLVRAFQALKLFHSKVDAQLADALLNRFLLPMIADCALVVECSLVNNQLELVLVDTRQDGGEGDYGRRRPQQPVQPPSPLALAAALEPMLVTLRDCLLSLPLADGGDVGGGSGAQPVTLADRLRPLIEERLAERLIADCLAKTVPADWEGLQAYGQTAAAVEALERQLVFDCRLLSPEVSRLGAFVRDIAAVFADKRVAAVLEAGRAIAAGPLADSVAVGAEPEDTAAGETAGEEAALVEKYIDKRAFAFPSCRVSRPAVDLLAYIERVCQEAEGYGLPSDTFAAELRCRVGLCCRKLLALFRVTAAAVHAEQLAAVPQLAALYYNSCHYLAYCSVDIEHRYVGPLLSGGRQPPPSKCLVDAAAALRADGARIFLAQLGAQRALVLEPMTHLTLGQQSSGGSYEANSRLCRQSCHQLECLGRVWAVLPAKIHCKSLGSLAHSLLAALVTFALAQEDFDCRDANDLARIFQWVQGRIADAFAAAPGASPERFVPSWLRFALLGQMLSAPLAAFPDLWCDGKSPLAEAFTDAEVRGLVKALFTNTDDRAAVLAKIK